MTGNTFHGKFRERPFQAFQLTQQAIDAHLLKGCAAPAWRHRHALECGF